MYENFCNKIKNVCTTLNLLKTATILKKQLATSRIFYEHTK
jgi:hypothetical protein